MLPLRRVLGLGFGLGLGLGLGFGSGPGLGLGSSPNPNANLRRGDIGEIYGGDITCGAEMPGQKEGSRIMWLNTCSGVGVGLGLGVGVGVRGRGRVRGGWG